MYKWRWPRTTWGFAKKKIYLDLGDELFGVAWMSPDCKMIKGTHFDKKKFIAKLLSQQMASANNFSPPKNPASFVKA